MFQIVGRSHRWSPYLNMLGKHLQLKTTSLLVFFLCLVKSFEKLVNNRIVDHLEKCSHFWISSMVLGLLSQLQIFWQLYLTSLGLLEL